MTFIVTEKAQRPGGAGIRDGMCFYCGRKIGVEHAPDCVLVKRKCKIRMTVEYEVEVPSSWDKDMVEFHRNDSSWCCNNMLRELDELSEKLGCLCWVTSCEFVEFTSEPELSE